MNIERFQARKTSPFRWGVFDTQPELSNIEERTADDAICESNFEEDALMVADALNGRAP